MFLTFVKSTLTKKVWKSIHFIIIFIECPWFWSCN